MPSKSGAGRACRTRPNTPCSKVRTTPLATTCGSDATSSSSRTGATGTSAARKRDTTSSVGNPAIADISIQTGNLLVITGKTFGITNIIALDADRNVIQDQRVLVKRDEAKVVNLQRGTLRQSYNCTPQCNPSITIGDEQAYFDTIQKASQAKIGFSERAASSDNALSIMRPSCMRAK